MEENGFFAALEDLTQDTSFSDAMARLHLISKIESGLAQADAGELLAPEQAWEAMRAWLL